MAFVFDGSTMIDLTDTAVNFLPSPATVEFWVKTSSDTAQAVFAYSPQSPSVQRAFALYIGANVTGSLTNELITFIETDISVPTQRIGGFTSATRTLLVDGNWHHVAFVATGSTWLIYLDGTARTVTMGAGTNVGKFAADEGNALADCSGVTVGGQRNNAGTAAVRMASGSELEDVNLHSRALSAAEILAIYKGLPSRPAKGLALDLHRSLRNGTGEVATVSGAASYASGHRRHMRMGPPHQPKRGLARRMALEGLYVGSDR